MPEQLIGDRGSLSSTWTTDTPLRHQSVMPIWIPFAASAIKIVYANANGGFGNGTPQAANYKGSAVVAGVYHQGDPGTGAGDSALIPDGDWQEFTVTLNTAGPTLADIITLQWVDSGHNCGNHTLSGQWGDRYESGPAITDKCAGANGGIAAIPLAANSFGPNGPGPAMIIGVPADGSPPCLLAYGDSLTTGVGCSVYQSGISQVMARHHRIPFTRYGAGGNGLSAMLSNLPSALAQYALSKVNHVALCYGTNDMAGETLASGGTTHYNNIKSAITTLRADFPAMRVIVPTTPPRVSLTDAGVGTTTLGNQVHHASTPAILQFETHIIEDLESEVANSYAWDMNGAGATSALPGLASARGSGKFRIDLGNIVPDGTHPSGLGVRAAALTLDPLLAFGAAPIASADGAVIYSGALAATGERVSLRYLMPRGSSLPAAGVGMAGFSMTAAGAVVEVTSVDTASTAGTLTAWLGRTIPAASALVGDLDEAANTIVDAAGRKAIKEKVFGTVPATLPITNSSTATPPTEEPSEGTVLEDTFSRADVNPAGALEVGGGSWVDEWNGAGSANRAQVVGNKLRLGQDGGGDYTVYASAPDALLGAFEVEFTPADDFGSPTDAVNIGMRYATAAGISNAYRIAWSQSGGAALLAAYVGFGNVHASSIQIASRDPALANRLRIELTLNEDDQVVTTAKLIDVASGVVVQTTSVTDTTGIGNAAAGKFVVYRSGTIGEFTYLDNIRASATVADTTKPVRNGAPYTSADGLDVFVPITEENSFPLEPDSIEGADGFTIAGWNRTVTHVARVGETMQRLRLNLPVYQGMAGGTLTYTEAAGSILDSAGNELTGFAGVAITNNSTAPSPPVASVAVTPDAPAAVAGGATIQFSATLLDEDGEEASPDVTWSTTLGSIDENGLWTAPPETNAVQNGTVTATSVANPLVSDTVNVSVLSGGTLAPGQRDALWSFGELEQSEMQSLSTEFVSVPVRVSVDFAPIDPSALPAWIAFTDMGELPADGDWRIGQWLYSGGWWHIARLVGPRSPSTITLAAGSYAVWIRVQDNPEHLVRKIGTLTVS